MFSSTHKQAPCAAPRPIRLFPPSNTTSTQQQPPQRPPAPIAKAISHWDSVHKLMYDLEPLLVDLSRVSNAGQQFPENIQNSSIRDSRHGTPALTSGSTSRRSRAIRASYFKDPPLSVSHTLNSSDSKPWAACRCVFLGGRPPHRMDKHWLACPANTSTNKKPHACPMCPERFSRNFNLQRHINTWHPSS